MTKAYISALCMQRHKLLERNGEVCGSDCKCEKCKGLLSSTKLPKLNRPNMRHDRFTNASKLELYD